MFEKTTNLSNGAGPGRNLQPGQTARILSGPRANHDVRVRALQARDVVEVEDVESDE